MRYRRPSRLRRVANWIDLAVCLVIIAGWASTLWTATSYQGATWNCTLSTGELSFDWFEGTPHDVREYGRHYEQGLDVYVGDGCFKPGYRWRVALKPQWPRYYDWEIVSKEDLTDLPEYEDTISLKSVFVPLWIPLALAAIPSGVLWWPGVRQRFTRRRPGHCPHCGYNLTGNESGVCPECATPVAKEANAGSANFCGGRFIRSRRSPGKNPFDE